MKRFLAASLVVGGLAGWSLGASPASATTGDASPALRGASARAAAEPGAFCTPASCRPRPASPLDGAAFGAVVLAIGWQARRRSRGHA